VYIGAELALFENQFSAQNLGQILKRIMAFRADLDELSLRVQPVYWYQLSSSDQLAYQDLQNEFYQDARKSRKGERLECFMNRIKCIKRFVQQHDDSDWKRSLVCGIFFFPESIVINIQQLRILMGKCKSSINGSLQQLGYVADPQGQGVERELWGRIPAPHRNLTDMKKWTVRRNKPALETLQPKEPLFVIPVLTSLKK
jgi:hypothetical protein